MPVGPINKIYFGRHAILCHHSSFLPSLLGAAALLVERAVYRDITEWRELPSALIALGSFVGAPLVSIAAVVGGMITFSCVPTKVKYAHKCVVAVAALATFSLLFRFARQ